MSDPVDPAFRRHSRACPRVRRPVFNVAVLAAVLLASTAATVRAQLIAPSSDLKALSIEQLMNIDVTLATREPVPLSATAAAIDVMTADDLRRAGVTNIADALALADGVQVARFNNGSWAISSRGFNATAANKLLVMVDGRTEYSPLFSGAFWNMVDYLLADIDRIEVIRGPGAALWGANAVNGVINIVTKHSRDTQGTYAAIGAGNEDPALADFRYGGTTNGATYRIYGKFAGRDAQVFNTGQSSGDGRKRGQAGFRIDSAQGRRDTWLVKGDAFHSRDDLPDRPSGAFTELDLQTRWSRGLGGESRLDVQSYYRREERRIPAQLTHHIDTVDLDVQHGLTMQTRHRIVWGAGARLNSDQTVAGTVRFDPPSRHYSVLSVFGQDEIAIRPDRMYVTAGLKIERNAFSGAEWQPDVRVRLHFARQQTIWAAVSRAARRPTRLDVDVRALTPTGVVIAVGGGDAYKAEILVGAQLGYRVQPNARLAFDATVFSNDYDDLRSQELPASGPPIVVGNSLNARAHGVEFAATVQPLAMWRLHASYAYLALTITRDADSRDIGGGASESDDPRHQLGLRTSLDLPHRFELDGFVRHVGALPNPAVPAYSELNMRVGWRATSHVDLSLIGQDLLHDHHPEFGAILPARVEFERSVRAEATFRY